MAKEPIERPIELAPAKVLELLGARRGPLMLPINPEPVLTLEARKALCLELLALGYMADVFDDITLITCGFDEGLLPSLRCPWGRGGDLLWVRERWAQVGRGFRYCNRETAQQASHRAGCPSSASLSPSASTRAHRHRSAL